MNDKDIIRTNLIDGYLLGRLNDEEMSRFKELLKDDALLRAEFENYEISREAVRNYALRSELKLIRHQMKEEDQPRGRTVSWWQYGAKVAAAVALLIVTFLAIQFATLSGERLYDGKAFPNEAWITRGTTPQEEDQRIKELFAAEEYQEVIKVYEATQQPSITAAFIAGNAYLRQNATSAAISTFERVEQMNAATEDKRFAEDTPYYLALSYLRAGEYDQALEKFEQIKTSDSRYNEYIGSYFLLKLKVLSWVD